MKVEASLKWLSSTARSCTQPCSRLSFFSDNQKKENRRWRASETTRGTIWVPWAAAGCCLLCESVLWVLFLLTEPCRNLPNLLNPKFLISVAQHNSQSRGGGKTPFGWWDRTSPGHIYRAGPHTEASHRTFHAPSAESTDLSTDPCTSGCPAETVPSCLN